MGLAPGRLPAEERPGDDHGQARIDPSRHRRASRDVVPTSASIRLSIGRRRTSHARSVYSRLSRKPASSPSRTVSGPGPFAAFEPGSSELRRHRRVPTTGWRQARPSQYVESSPGRRSAADRPASGTSRASASALPGRRRGDHLAGAGTGRRRLRGPRSNSRGSVPRPRRTRAGASSEVEARSGSGRPPSGPSRSRPGPPRAPRGRSGRGRRGRSAPPAGAGPSPPCRCPRGSRCRTASFCRAIRASWLLPV